MSGLSSAQLAFYKEQGYLLVEDVIPPADFQPLIDEFNASIDEKARVAHAAGKLTNLFEHEPFARRLAKITTSAGGEAIAWQYTGIKYKSAAMFAVMTHPAILDMVESVIGPEILAHPQFNVRAKLPNQESTVVPWHQDLGYLERDAEETFMVNFWIPLVDATVENGCMQVIAGSHTWPLIEHVMLRDYRGIADESLLPGDVVTCPVRVGSVLLIQHKTVHRSIPNHSDHIRWSMDLRYSDPSQPTGRDDVPGFIARSKANPESITKSVEDWLRLMKAES